jgi:hypothetical protein
MPRLGDWADNKPSCRCIWNSQLFPSIPDAKLEDDFKIYTIIKLDNGGHIKPLNAKEKLGDFLLFLCIKSERKKS